MKTDKALQLYKGKPFMQHVIGAITPLNNTPVIVSSKKEHRTTYYQTIEDVEIDKGPVSAIVSALGHSVSTLNLISCCDTPLLKTSFLEWLILNHNNKYQATVGTLQGKKMPLTALYNKSCETVFRNHLKNNQLKVMTVLKDLKVNFIEIPDEFQNQLLNVNTPEQLNSLSL